MGSYVRRLAQVIAEYRLERFCQVAPIVALLRSGRTTESQAKAYLIWLQPLVKRQMESPNLLEAPPDAAQLYADGKPDIELGTLENGLRFGIRYKDRPRSIICCGSAGSGKTSCIRRIVTLIAGDGHEETDVRDHS